MTNTEFSDQFDTLLNSYASQAVFGEQAAKSEIVLDEYEKSVILTNAQDIVVKSYFDRKKNSTNDGFDDSTERQIDFSSLIKTASLTAIQYHSTDDSPAFDDRGLIYKMPLRKFPIVTRADLRNTASCDYTPTEYTIEDPDHLVGDTVFHIDVTSFIDDRENIKLVYSGADTIFRYAFISEWHGDKVLGTVYSGTLDFIAEGLKGRFAEVCIWLDGAPAGDSTISVYTVSPSGSSTITEWEAVEGSTDVLFILNEKLVTTVGSLKKNYVVVPINYREYDREMSKAYGQPLKKQAWRLFQNSIQGFDIQSELIPRWNLTKDETIQYYKIRYIRRPTPIVLVDLPNGLSVDGISTASECELNPIMHPEILQKAVELAAASRGIVSRNANNQDRQ